MFIKYIVILITVTAASAMCPKNKHQVPRCRHRDYKGKTSGQNSDTFEDLANSLQALDEALRASCAEQDHWHTREAVDAALPGFLDSDFKVYIKGRILSIDASNASGKRYHEVRMLPTFASAADATYSYDGGELSVSFPVDTNATACRPAGAGPAATGPAATGPAHAVPVYVNDAGHRGGFL